MVNKTASCRVCVVEIQGRPNLAPACSTLVMEGMLIRTNTVRVIQDSADGGRTIIVNHPNECFTCPKNLECELQALAQRLGIREIEWTGEKMQYDLDTSSKAIVKNPNKCIMCRRCETMCNQVQTCGILSAASRGFDSFVGPAFNIPIVESSCTYCGQCVAVCPTAALTEVNHTGKVWAALNDPDKYVIVQTLQQFG